MSVQLERGERLELQKPGGGELSHIALALEVESSSGAGVPDDSFEFACAFLDGNRNVVDVVHPMRTVTRDGSTRHCGRRICIHLNYVSASVQHILVFAVARGSADFADVESATLRITDRADKAICHHSTTGGDKHTASLLARLYRENADWKILPLGTPANGRTLDAVLPQVRTTC